jgi:hypothetical protein
MVSILASMEEWIFLLMVATLAMSCLTSCWVSVKLDYKELKRASKSCLQVWVMMKRENEKGRVGPNKKWVMGELYHDDQVDKGNPMG